MDSVKQTLPMCVLLNTLVNTLQTFTLFPGTTGVATVIIPVLRRRTLSQRRFGDLPKIT